MRPNFHPVDFHSFIGVTRKSTVTPPVPNLKVFFDSKGYTHIDTHTETHTLTQHTRLNTSLTTQLTL